MWSIEPYVRRCFRVYSERILVRYPGTIIITSVLITATLGEKALLNESEKNFLQAPAFIICRTGALQTPSLSTHLIMHFPTQRRRLLHNCGHWTMTSSIREIATSGEGFVIRRVCIVNRCRCRAVLTLIMLKSDCSGDDFYGTLTSDYVGLRPCNLLVNVCLLILPQRRQFRA